MEMNLNFPCKKLCTGVFLTRFQSHFYLKVMKPKNPMGDETALYSM